MTVTVDSYKLLRAKGKAGYARELFIGPWIDESATREKARFPG